MAGAIGEPSQFPLSQSGVVLRWASTPEDSPVSPTRIGALKEDTARTCSQCWLRGETPRCSFAHLVLPTSLHFCRLGNARCTNLVGLCEKPSSDIDWVLTIAGRSEDRPSNEAGHRLANQ
jgi:hypothetical protein